MGTKLGELATAAVLTQVKDETAAIKLKTDIIPDDFKTKFGELAKSTVHLNDIAYDQ